MGGTFTVDKWQKLDLERPRFVHPKKGNFIHHLHLSFLFFPKLARHQIDATKCRYFLTKHGQKVEIIRQKNDLRVNLEQVIILGIGGEEVGNADHCAAKGPSVLHATLVLLLTGSHPPYTTSAKI